MSDEPKPFEGWAILELLGHRRMGGYVRETSLAGAGVLRIDVPSRCTGLSAGWCPVHGDCVCPENEYGEKPSLEDPKCPIHSPDSTHGEWIATQFYSASALYALSPCSEEAARAVAAVCEPEPVHQWELPKPAPAKPERGVAYAEMQADERAEKESERDPREDFDEDEDEDEEVPDA